MADQADTSLQAFDDARKKFEKTIAEMNKSDSPGVVVGKEAKPALEEINTEFKKISAAVADLKTQGIPIGTDYFPHCLWYGKKETVEPSCKDAKGSLKSPSSREIRFDYFFWILKVLITGMLIGLGGPFWYDAVRGLMRTTQLFRGRDQPREPTPGKRAGESEPAKPAEVFEKHVEKTVTSDPRWRPAGSMLPVKPKTYGGPRWRPPVDNVVVTTLAEGDPLKPGHPEKTESIPAKPVNSE
jgi:hypothetical protein